MHHRGTGSLSLGDEYEAPEEEADGGSRMCLPDNVLPQEDVDKPANGDGMLFPAVTVAA